jgi:DNA polymerase III delta subunit
MIILLLGPDDFSKKEYNRSLAQKYKAETEIFVNPDAAPQLAGLLEQDLFAKTKISVLEGLLPKYDFNGEILDKLAASKNIIIFEEEKIDRRLAVSKLLLSHKSVETKEFALPHGKDLDAWITNRVKDLGGSISKAGVNFLAEKLGRDETVETKFGGKIVDVKEIYSLWQADGEIKKLLAYADGTEIGEAEIRELVFANSEVDTLQIANAIGEKNKQLAFEQVADFLAEGGEEKGRIIQLNALLSEQFRNILIVQDFVARKIPEGEILQQTGWKSGRLFVTKKTAARFTPKIVKDLLAKLASLDREMKTSSTPPRVLLELILSQLFI